MTTNKERQADEIEAISSICEDQEFFRLPAGQKYEIALNVSPTIEKRSLDVRYSNVIFQHCASQTFCHFSVKNLPPACLSLSLPVDYPEVKPPIYQLEISWLAPWQCSLICQRLDELWNMSAGSEILFVWRDFLRSEILDFLSYKESLDVSFLFAIYDEPDDSVTIGLIELADERAKNEAMFLHPRQYLARYDESRRSVVFSRAFHNCGICLGEFSGRRCMEFPDCGHVYCKLCIAEYFTVKINVRSVTRIICPELNCRSVARNDQIKEICPNLYRKYDESVLKTALSTMNDVVFCPRSACQSPVITEPDENLATCSSCEYNFCSFCRKVYHGVAPCVMITEDSAELVNTYLRADKTQKQQLLKKHGRRQIQLIVEDTLTKEYLKKNTKACPKCETPTEKINGCNKMLCSNCQASFCWLCGILITSRNTYDHFTAIGHEKTCLGRLFEGMPGAEDEIPVQDDRAENIDNRTQ